MVLLLLLEQLPVVGRLVRVQLAALVLDGGPPAAGRALVRVDDALAVDGPRTRRAEDGFRFVRLDLAVREQIADELLALEGERVGSAG